MEQLGGKICCKLWWKNRLESYVKKKEWTSCVEKYCEKSAGKSVHLKVYSVQYTVYSVQCTVYSVQCKMYSKVVLLSLWGEPQCSSVWGVEPSVRLLLCLTPPEHLNEQLSGTSKWSECQNL